MFQLVFECAVGVFVLVPCFVDRKATENAIVDRLGDGFSRPPFATVVVLYIRMPLVIKYFIFFLCKFSQSISSVIWS